jgi:signal transduction histidine kinase
MGPTTNFTADQSARSRILTILAGHGFGGRRAGSGRRLGVSVALLILLVGMVQMAASLLFYHAIDRQTLREDHARRVAELLVVSDRVHAVAPQNARRIMTTRHLEVTHAPRPAVARSERSPEVTEIAEHILVWEPSLAARRLHLALESRKNGRRDLVGSMALADGHWLNFRSRDISSVWPIALWATAMTLLVTLACMGAALLGLRRLTTPLHTLSDAANAIARGEQVPLRESGAADLREIARSLNSMQARMTGIIDDQARSFEAISHDLRTPLARLKIASDLVADSDIARLVGSSADEMEAMLMSLQSYLRAQHLEAEPEALDLVPLLRDLLAGFEEPVRLDAPQRAETIAHREPLMLALRPLLENAVHYGQRVLVRLEKQGADWIIEINDDGPGIPEDNFGDILNPFFRLDEARARDTPGFGLGIPTAHCLLERFGGGLSFANAAHGGLIVTVRVPRPDVT